MKRHYWVFLFVVILGLTSSFFTLHSEAHTAMAARPVTQGTVSAGSPMGDHNVATKYGDCLRIARRAGGDCLR